jgi:hypothetical protein
MMKPKNIRAVETEETKTISHEAFVALNDTSLADIQADAIVIECNPETDRAWDAC